MQIIDTTFPCDTLILKEKLIYGSYAYEDGKRSGEVCFYDLKSLTEVKFSTTGTFCLKEKDELVYAANMCNIQVYKNEKLVETIETKCINTYLSIDNFIGVSTTAGELKLFNNFKEIHTYTLTNHTLWSVDQQNSLFVLGGEISNLFLVDIRTNKPSVIKSEMSPCVKFKDNFVYAGTYDGMVNVYDLRYNKLYDKFIGGQIWQLSFDDKFIVCACVYDGVKVLDYDFNIQNSFECGSIVYACDYYKGVLAYSSFYEKKIYLRNIDF